MSSHLIAELSIPFFSGAIGYITNWSGIWMLFNPLTFKGVKVPGLKWVVSFLPRKIQQIPGFMQGGLGWQGIIPSRAAKMGSVAVDKGIAKIGGPKDFYEQLEPDKIAEHILATARGDMREVVERIMWRDHAQLWAVTPSQIKEAVHARVQQQLPGIVHSVTDGIGANIDQLLDVKLMVIRHIEAHPELANRIFTEVGAKELKFIINFGFFFGFALGIPMVFITKALPYWYVLPIGGMIIGYLTNLLAIYMIFEPAEPRKIGPFTLQGLFLRRQHAAAEMYGTVIADDIITLKNIGAELLEGPRADRTRQLIETALRPAVDKAVGPARTAVRVAVGSKEYENIQAQVATEAVDYTMTPFADPEFNKHQTAKIKALIVARMQELSPVDFSEMLRSAMKEDEWLLFLHGAVLGIGAGMVHYAIFGVG